MDPLLVSMNGLLVGELSQRAGRLFFRYSESWLNAPSVRPISLSLPLSSDPLSGSRVDAFFSNLLPDDSRVWKIIGEQFHLPRLSVFSLLGAIGADCLGALSFCQPDRESVVNHDITALPVTDEQIAQELKNLPWRPLGLRGDDAFHISLAGVQDKTGFLYWQGRWWRPQGTTPTSHIFKVPIGEASGLVFPNSCENEWLCSHILSAFGLPVASTELMTFAGQKALVIERFDRRWSLDYQKLIRLPCEDFCQATGTPPEKKYEDKGGPGIVRCLNLLGLAQSDEYEMEKFLKAQILFWVLGAIDGHAKNFSIFLLPQGRIRLAPFYDVLSVWPLLDAGIFQKQKISMAMAWEGKNRHYRWSEIRPEHFLTTAKKAGWERNRVISLLQDLCGRTPSVLERIHSQLPGTFPVSVAAPILSALESNMQRLDDFLRKNKQ